MPATHIPAWKRLGLKLKYANETAETPSQVSTSRSKSHLNGHTSIGQDERPTKKIRFDDSDDNSNKDSQSKPARPRDLKKKVSFTADTKAVDGDTAHPANPGLRLMSTNGTNTTIGNESSAPNPNQPSSKSNPNPKSNLKPLSTNHTKPSPHKSSNGLDYLTQYFQHHSTWKFSKNRETWLLKNLFTAAIPPEYTFVLACYVAGLKAEGARERLRREIGGRIQSMNGDRRQEEEDSGEGGADRKREKYAKMRKVIEMFLGEGSVESVEADQIITWTNEQRREDILSEVLSSGNSASSSASTDGTTKGTTNGKYTVLDSESESEPDSDSDSDTNEHSAVHTASATKPAISKFSDRTSDGANEIQPQPLPQTRRQRKSKLRSNVDISSSESSSSSSGEDSSSDEASEAESSSSEARKSESESDSD